MRILPSLSRGLRLALILGLSTGYIAVHTRNADAKKHSDDDSGDDDDDSANDSGKNADDSDTDTGDTEEDVDKDQPLVTAGGLFTINTYPLRELARPLTLTKKFTQLRLGLGTDISAKGAFESVGVNLDAIYGVSDNFMVVGGINSAYNFGQFSLYGGFEGSLVYDVVDIRVVANIHRSAVPAHYVDSSGNNTTMEEDPSSRLVPGYGIFCDPPGQPNEQITPGHTSCQNAMATQDLLPTGKYVNGNTQFSVDLGFPFRYSFTPEVAIVALQTLMSIDFNAARVDHVVIQQVEGLVPDPANPLPPGETCQTMPMLCTTGMVPQSVARGNSAKPDLNPSVGIATNPIAALSLVVFAQLRVPDFDTAAGAFQVPVTLRAEFSPNQKLDIGLEFKLLNVKPPDPQSPLDNRFISAFMQARF